MKRRLIPRSRRDRRLLLIGLVAALFAILFSLDSKTPNLRVIALFEAVCAAIMLVVVYVFQDQEDSSQVRYSRMIEDIIKMGTTLTELMTFLKGEQKRIMETQRVLEELSREKEQIEPVVSTQRKVIEGILSAYSKGTRLSKWKDWTLAFCLGVLSSLVATYLFNLLRTTKQ